MAVRSGVAVTSLCRLFTSALTPAAVGRALLGRQGLIRAAWTAESDAAGGVPRADGSSGRCPPLDRSRRCPGGL